MIEKIKQLIIKYKKHIIQIFKYNIVGIINTLIDLLIFTLLLSLINLDKNIAKLISFSCGVLNSFIMNKLWTFQKNREFKGKELVKFIIINGITLGFSMLLINLLTMFRLDPRIGNSFAVFLAVIINYLGYKLWVFKA